MCALSLIEFAYGPSDTIQHILHYILKLHDKIPSHITIQLFVGSFTRPDTFFFLSLISLTCPLCACHFFRTCISAAMFMQLHLDSTLSGFMYTRISRFFAFVCRCVCVSCWLPTTHLADASLCKQHKRTIAFCTMSHIFLMVFGVFMWVCVCVARKSNRYLFENYQQRL